MSQFALKLALTAVKGVQRMLLKASMALVHLSFLYGTRGEVTSSNAESCVVSLLSTSWGWMKAGLDLHLLLPLCVDASEFGSTECFLGGKDDEGECDGDLGE